MYTYRAIAFDLLRQVKSLMFGYVPVVKIEMTEYQQLFHHKCVRVLLPSRTYCFTHPPYPSRCFASPIIKRLHWPHLISEKSWLFFCWRNGSPRESSRRVPVSSSPQARCCLSSEIIRRENLRSGQNRRIARQCQQLIL